MPSELEAAVRERVAQVLDDVRPDEVDPAVDLADEYGLTSLNKVLLLTMVCDDAHVDLGHFTEQDVAGLRSRDDIVAALSAHAGRKVRA
jgi:hypothetical protein